MKRVPAARSAGVSTRHPLTRSNLEAPRGGMSADREPGRGAGRFGRAGIHGPGPDEWAGLHDSWANFGQNNGKNAIFSILFFSFNFFL